MNHEPRAGDRVAQHYLEHYLTDPSSEPDPAKWEVDVAYLTREA